MKNKEYRNKKGQLHREDGPAVEDADGYKAYYVNGKLHREDGPAVELADGTKEYWVNGKRHREDGPAVEYTNGDKSYFVNGQRHREDGPAIEYANGFKAYYINGQYMSEQDFKNRKKPKSQKTPKSNLKISHIDNLYKILKPTGYYIEFYSMSDESCEGLVVKHNENDDVALHFNFGKDGKLEDIKLWEEIKQVVDEKQIW